MSLVLWLPAWFCLQAAVTAAMPIRGTDANASADGEAVVLKVGTNAAFRPFEYMDEDGKTPIGFDIDLINAIAADQGMTVEIHNQEFGRSDHGIEQWTD